MKPLFPMLILLSGCLSLESPILPDPPRDEAGFVIDTEMPATQSPAPKSNPEALRLEIAPAKRRLITIYTAEEVHGVGWCRPCRGLKSRWGDGNDQIRIEWSPKPVPSGPDSYPAVRWRDATGTVRFPVDPRGYYRVPDSLDELLQLIERNMPAKDVPDANLVGAAGVLHGRPQIVAVLEWVRKHVGENVPMSFTWDRTGAQTFPLLHGQDFSAVAWLGKSGRLSLSARAGKLPIDQVGFGYQVSGDDLILDVDPVKVDGLAKRLLPQSKLSLSTNRPVGFADPLTLWSIFSVFKMVWSLLHPLADLTLGGNVSATAVLRENMLAIDFQQMPAIRLVLLFPIHLAVRRIELTPDQCRILFDGSRFIRERTIFISD